MPRSVTRVVNSLLCSDELYCPLHQSGVAVAGATNAVNTRQSEAATSLPGSLILPWERGCAVTVSLFYSTPSPPRS